MTTYVNPGLDGSGNGNNWTVNNINWTTVGATYDTMTDVPTLTSATASNFAVMNPLCGRGTFSNGNLTVVSSVSTAIPSTIFSSSGKYYWEVLLVDATYGRVGICNLDGANQGLGETANTWCYLTDGRVFHNNSASSYGVTATDNDIINVALDLDAGKIWYGKNGTWMASGSPSTGANPSQSFTANQTMTAAVAYGFVSGTDTFTANFGQRPFAYTPPTGYVALNTFNLPTPTIGATASTQANKYFDVNTWTGTGATNVITNSGSMQPDFVWIKGRSNATYHMLTNAVTGPTKYLYSNDTLAEGTWTDQLTSFNSTGFTLGADTNSTVNFSGRTYVGWQWRASNATAVTNTAGSITSTVSANTTAGFSVVTFTSPASGTCSVGHGLGVKPSMVIVKCRSVGNSGWFVWHQALGDNNTDYLMLHSTAAEQSYSTMWGTVGRTSTLLGFTQGGTLEANATHVAYAFSEVAGYSKFGSYTGNGSSDGTFVFTGFRPKYVLIRRTDSGNNWFVLDSARNTYNLTNAQLYPNASSAEATGSDCNVDFLSNGFKLRTALDASNGSGGNYIYACFAENPFKYSLAR